MAVAIDFFSFSILYNMPRKFGRKPLGRKPRKVSKASSGGRRLTKTFKPFQPVRNVGRGIARGYRKAKVWATGRRPITKALAQRNFNQRLLSSDNIITAPAFKIGIPRKVSFEEKVSKITHPPVIYKRQYAWSAEGISGRKTMFQIPINCLLPGVSGGTLYDDVMTNASARMSTNTSTVDPTIIFNNDHRTQQSYYVDYYSGKLKMSNSSSNSLTGKISLVGYKRDCKASFTNTTTPCTPVNMLAFSQTANANTNYVSGTEATVGNGLMFNDTTQSSDYDANYMMPGSSINFNGVCLAVDPDLHLLSPQIKDFTGYYFNILSQYKFSLKPGQQFNISTIINDLPTIKRQGIDMTYLRGVSNFLVIEFEGQIVGDATVTTGDNVITTGSSQLSCIYEEKRIVGVHGKLRSQIYMGTAPLAVLSKSVQYTINADTGVADTGVDDDA